MATFVFTHKETSLVLHAIELAMREVMGYGRSETNIDSALARLDNLAPIRHRLLNALAFPEQREPQDGAEHP